MITFFPQQISHKAIYIYLGSLVAVSLLFLRYAMPLPFMIIGIIWVTGFFLLVNLCSRKWLSLSEKSLSLYLFLTALGLRWAWVIFSYFFYTHRTGMPFEFEAADSLAYYADGIYYASLPIKKVWSILIANSATISDSGYYLYLSLLCRLTGMSIILPRLINSLFSAATVVILYHLAKRNIGDEGGRLAAIMACFMPNLIYYCGLHLKETVMLFLVVAFLERADYLIRTRHYTVLTVTLPVLIGLYLYTFRTVLALAAFFSFATALIFTTTNIIGRRKRYTMILWGLLAVGTLYGGTIRTENEAMWESRFENQSTKRITQTNAGNRWAKYATGTVMAPLMFVLPFPTMVDVDQQYNQQLVSGGNYVRTFLGGFVLVAIVSAIFVKRNWRDLSLVGAFVVSYLGVVSASGFSNSERFLLPALPGLLIMAAYGVTELNAKNYRIVKYWYYVVPVAVFGWAVFKLGSRGIIL